MLDDPAALHGLAEKNVVFPTAPPAPGTVTTSNPHNPAPPALPSSASNVTPLSAVINQQLSASDINKQRAQNLSQVIQTTLKSRREAAQAALTNAKTVEQKWVAVEAEMYKALQPYTTEALKSRMARAVSEAEQVSELLADSFLENNSHSHLRSHNRTDSNISNSNGKSGASGDNLIVDDSTISKDFNEFIKNYRKERKTYHSRKEIMERWKEERVSRTY